MALLFSGCVIQTDGSGRDDDYEGDSPASGSEDRVNTTSSKCSPTGLQFLNTGVYIGPRGCSSISLYPMDESPTNDAWALEVGFDMRGRHDALEVRNATTGDTEREIIYIGDPNFAVYVGSYPLTGLELAAGVNKLQYEIFTYDEETEPPVRRTLSRGDFQLQVELSPTLASAED